MALSSSSTNDPTITCPTLKIPATTKSPGILSRGFLSGLSSEQGSAELRILKAISRKSIMGFLVFGIWHLVYLITEQSGK